MRRKSLVILIVLGLMMSLVVAGCRSKDNGGNQAGGPSGTITVAGSTSVQPVSELLAEAFMSANPNVKVTVQGGGSGVGIEQSAAGTINIGASSRDLKPEEKNLGLKEIVICKDGIAVIVNPANKVADLSMSQLMDIYAGKITNWKDVGGDDAEITLINREAGSGTRGAFEDLVMGTDNDTELKKSVEQNSTGAVKSSVAADKNSIGYISLTGLAENVKAVKIDGTMPSIETVRNGEFKISRPFVYLTKGEPNQLMSKFLQFVESPDGQKVIEEEGLVTLK